MIGTTSAGLGPLGRSFTEQFLSHFITADGREAIRQLAAEEGVV